MTWRVDLGDCCELMAGMPDASVDAVVCDPPYGLEFMGKDWDRLDSRAYLRTRQDGRTNPSEGKSTVTVPESYVGGIRAQRWHQAWATEALRVLKPGGHLLAFGGTRTYHRLACAVEDAGFEIRDTISWLYGQGFPKSLNVGCQCERRVRDGASDRDGADGGTPADPNGMRTSPGPRPAEQRPGELGAVADEPRSQTGGGWALCPGCGKPTAGLGTALKPAHEPVVVARKPLSGTVAANCLEHGTGALNVDGCRVEHDEKSAEWVEKWSGHSGHDATMYEGGIGKQFGGSPAGRWPANVVLDEAAARLLDEQTGELVPGTFSGGQGMGYHGGNEPRGVPGYGDSGGASRFFLTVPTDTLCVLCNLPCVESAGNTSPPSEAPSDTAPGDAQGSLSPAAEGSRPSSDTSASTAESGSPTTPAAPMGVEVGVTAQTAAAAKLAREIVPLARSVVNLCDSCTTAIAQNVVLWLINPTRESQAGPDSTSVPNVQTLSRNLALVAEGWQSTGITPTTDFLSALFGSAAAATTAPIRASDTVGATDRLRLRYCPKSSRQERNAGLDGFEEKGRTLGHKRCSKCGRQKVNMPGSECVCPDPEWVAVEDHAPRANGHPTVKPISLMRWLVRLVTPPGGTVLDPFTGSGTTGIAAVLEGFDFIGLEREDEYVQIARARIAWWEKHRGEGEAEAILAAGSERDGVERAGQGSLFDEAT